jgi:competence ComEA-like helix-hairpin-helix protein
MKLLSAMMVLLVALPLVFCPSVHAGKKEMLKSGEKIDINTASKAELMKLPGVGEKKSERIIENRPFTNAADLKSKKIGIGEKTLEKWGDSITFGKPAAEKAKVAPKAPKAE